MPKSPTRTLLAAVLAAGGLGLAAQHARPTMAPLSPEFIAWQQQKLERQQRQNLGAGEAVRDHRFGYTPEPMAPIRLQKDTRTENFLFAAPPASYDLRTQNALTAVRNQNPFGTCWSFSAMASLESSLLKGGAGSLNFSEWHLAYFVYNPFSAAMPAFHKGTADYGDDPTFDLGGNNSKSVALLSRGTGPVSEASCPYQTSKTYLPSTLPKGTEPSAATLREALYMGTAFDATTVKTALMAHGALATPIFWEDNGATTFYSSTTHAYRRLNPTDAENKNKTNHLVNIVGWDDAYPKTNFPTGNQPSADGAWIMRNSWGSGWGEAGYFYMSYDTYVNSFAAFKGTTQATGRIYQYDPLGAISYLGYDDPTAWFANVFTAQANENLQSVAFYARTPGTYEVSVKTGITGDPSTGTFVAAPQTGTFEASGYHTLDLNTPVPLAAGQKFAVLVKLTTPGNKYTIPIEYAETDYSESATANPGEGFTSGDGTTWKDITDWKSSCSICLKAIAAQVAPGATTLTSFTPASGGPGSTVTLAGSGFTGATAVTINGATASYVITGDWEIVATVPAGAASGPITVASPSGTATSSTPFTVTTSQVAVAITPQILGYVVGSTKQFTASVTGSANAAVTWSSIPTGLVSATGLFTAPAAATPSVTVTATSVADPTKSASLSFPVRDRNLNLSSDGTVDVLDLATLSKHFGATGLSASDAAAVCDLNGDGEVNEDDITLFFLGF